MSTNLRLTKLMVLRGLRARARLSQLLAAKQEEQLRLKAREKAVEAHRKAVKDAKTTMATAMQDAASIRDPGGRYAAVVNRMSQAHTAVETALDRKFEADYDLEDAQIDVTEARGAFALAAREESKLETLETRRSAADRAKAEARDEDALSDLMATHRGWRAV